MNRKARCPKCEAAIATVKFEVAEVSEHAQNVASCGLYLCPLCNTVLGVGLHPEVFVSDIVERLKSGLRSQS